MAVFLSDFDIGRRIPLKQRKEIKFFYIPNKSNILFVTNDDKVFAFGNDFHSLVGLENKEDNEWAKEPKEVIEWSGKRIERFFVDHCNVFALSADNRLYSWGRNHCGQLGRGFVSLYGKPAMVNFDFGTKIINSVHGPQGGSVLAVTEDNKLFIWGNNRDKLFGNNLGEVVEKPTELKLSDSSGVKNIYTRFGHPINDYFALTTDYELYWLGRKQYEINDIASDVSLHKLIGSLKDYKVIDITFFSNHIYFLNGQGELFEWNLSGKQEPKKFETKEKFIRFGPKGSDLVLSENHTVYRFTSCPYLHKVMLEKTKYNSFKEYHRYWGQISTDGTIRRVKSPSEVLEELKDDMKHNANKDQEVVD